ncbi:MAG: citrate/2-methylcitrate synthase [Gammaproteobacteria bacterium]
MSDTAKPAKQGGLAGVVAGQTSISTVGKAGVGLTYRGYAIEDFAAQGTFEEVAYLLIYDTLPTEQQLQQFKERLKKGRHIPSDLQSLLVLIPQTANMMDVLRTVCSYLGCITPESPQNDAYHIAENLLSCLPSALLFWYQFHLKGIRIDTETPTDTLAAHILYLLSGQPADPVLQRALDISLILYAEHEFNASTFAARVTTATESDFYSAICSAIGTLRGDLHGGANEKAMELIESFVSSEEVASKLRQMLAEKKLVMGFGHRVYSKSDPRSEIIKPLAKQLAESAGDKRLYPIAEAIEKVMWDEKKLFPNVDFFSAISYHFLGVPTPMFTPFFVFARLAGWTAHILEQRSSKKLIRPDAEYIGPGPQAYIGIQNRD